MTATTTLSSLHEIAKRYSTDKAEHLHYLANYERYFSPLRHSNVKLLELGIRDGGSLYMWRDFFHHGRIAGLDIEAVTLDDPSGRITTYTGEQQDKTLLSRIADDTAPEGFDVIVDDCSHIAALSRVSFDHLFYNHLRPGGIYVIEDWGSGYWDDWADGARYRQNDRGSKVGITDRIGYKLASIIRKRQDPGAGGLLSRIKRPFVVHPSSSHNAGMVGFIKELIDECAIEDIRRGRSEQKGDRSQIDAIHISASHAFVFKTA